MAAQTREARVLFEIPLAGGAGRRVIAEAEDGSLHVFTVRGDSQEGEPDQSFTRRGAVRLAELVLAGDEQAMTAPATVRILAAALTIK